MKKRKSERAARVHCVRDATAIGSAPIIASARPFHSLDPGVAGFGLEKFEFKRPLIVVTMPLMASNGNLASLDSVLRVDSRFFVKNH